jgi:hypothetical protein
MSSLLTKNTVKISHIIVGDELGQIKKIDLTMEKPTVTTVNGDEVGDQLAPDKSILSIRAFPSSSFSPPDQEDDEDDEEEGKSKGRERLCRGVFVICQKPDRIYLYNSNTDSLTLVVTPTLMNESNLLGAAPVDYSNIVIVYEDGGIFKVNVEAELLQANNQSHEKALKVLGIDEESKKRSLERLTEAKIGQSKRKKQKKEQEFEANPLFDPVSIVADPKMKSTVGHLTCFEVDHDRILVGGKNVEPTVYNLKTNEKIFVGKKCTKGSNWLGLQQGTWVSGVCWLGPITSARDGVVLKNLNCKVEASFFPSFIASCSKTDPIVRIYDIRAKNGGNKPSWVLNLKEATFANDTNPPSFSSITASPSPHACAVPTQQLILGTTMGRMMAIELRFNSHSYRQLGAFKGFSGGTVRDIVFVGNVKKVGDHRIVSCSLDRFVRVHSFKTGANAQRKLETKVYIKTRPTSIQPVLASPFETTPKALERIAESAEEDYQEEPVKEPDSIEGDDVSSEEGDDSEINVADFDEL